VPRNWNQWLETASGPASFTEDVDRERTQARIQRAIAQAADIPATVRVYAKGSYANNTNVRRDSDVDIAVEWQEQFYVQPFGEAVGLSAVQLGYEPAGFNVAPTPAVFRASVERAMVAAFGDQVDISGASAIHVVRGEDALDADVVPCFAMRRYDRPNYFWEGHRVFRKDSGYFHWADNYPEQQRQNGNAKNAATRRRYKELVRCLKRIEGELVDQRILGRGYPSYLIECLVYNVPNDVILGGTRYEALDRALVWLWDALATQAMAFEEVSGLLWMFRGRTDRIPANARNLVYLAWNRLHDQI
jgi:hypothetical protein